MAQILLVEDNCTNAQLAQRRLRLRGHVVTLAEDGAAALEQVARSLPDIILLDLHIPFVDGFDCAQRWKGDLRTASIPIIALSAHAMAPERKRALDAGCDAFIPKPVPFDLLDSWIGRLLPTLDAPT